MSKDNIGDHRYKRFTKEQWAVTVTKDGNIEIRDHHSERRIVLLRHHVPLVRDLLKKAFTEWGAGASKVIDIEEAA